MDRTTRGASALPSAASTARRSATGVVASLGGVNTRADAVPQAGQGWVGVSADIGWLTSKIEQSGQRKTYVAMTLTSFHVKNIHVKASVKGCERDGTRWSGYSRARTSKS
jgi:hypothetical protein